MYKPLQSNQGARSQNTVSLMPKKGINKRDLPQLLKPENAIEIVNYILSSEGGMPKREGISILIDKEDENPITMIEEWQGYFIFGWGGNSNQWALSAYNISTGTITDIKTDFDSPITGGEPYGGYFFVASPKHKIGRLTLTLNYDNQTGNFAGGLEVTGGTSGATAKILEDNDGGTTGTLTLGDISGVFEDNEIMTDSGTGSADVNGIIGFSFSEISNAPRARVIKAINTRLFAGDLEEDSSSIRYSHVDDGGNPPFQTWSVATSATAGGLIGYKKAGKVKVIDNIGNIIVIGNEKGKWAFTIDIIDSSGTLSKKDTTVMFRIDAGMTASLQTKEGIFYTNSEGIWRLTSLGQSDIKFSDQEILVTNILGNKYFENASFDDADIEKDDRRNLLLITYRDNSEENNRVICLNTDLNAFSIFKGWGLRSFIKRGGVIYGGGSSSGKVWKLFDGYSDDGKEIACELEQELSVGQLWTRKDMLGQYIQGKLSPSTSIKIDFSIYDRVGRYVDKKLTLVWTASLGFQDALEYGSTPYGGPFGGSYLETGEIESFAGFKGVVRNFQRLRVKTYERSSVPHELNWLSIRSKEKSDIRIRNLTQV